MTDRELQRHIATKSFLPVYLLYGEEDFLMERTAKAIMAAALGDSDPSFNLDLFRGTENKADEITTAANAFPFMGEKRVVSVRESDGLLKQPALAQYVRNPSPDTVLILCAGALKPPRPSRAKKPAATADVLSLLRAQEQSPSPAAAVVEYKALRDADALQWIVREIEREGKSITPEACTVFHALKGNNARELSSEIEKLLVAAADRNEIGSADIYDQLGASRQYNVFELSNAVLERDARRAQEITQHLLRSDEPLMIVNTLWRQISQLWRVRAYHFGNRVTDEDVRALGLVWAWQVEQFRKHAGNYRDNAYFDRCFEYILDADLSIKSQPADPGVVVTRLVAQLTSA